MTMPDPKQEPIGEQVKALYADFRSGITPRAELDAAVDRMASEISSLRGQLQEAERDAVRYRWLRDVGDATWRPFGLRDGCTAALADRAIDEAIRRATEAGKTHG